MRRLPLLPDTAPAMGRPLLRWAGQLLARSTRWRIEGDLPDLPKIVMIAAPHSSNWDGLYGVCAACAIGFMPNWMGKEALFKFPLGMLVRYLGGVYTDRSRHSSMVEQMAQKFAERERMWLVLAPEGTRKAVTRWRTGFYRIAVRAGVPIVPVAFHYPDRKIVIMAPFMPSGDIESDFAKLSDLYQPYLGRFGKKAQPSTEHSAEQRQQQQSE